MGREPKEKRHKKALAGRTHGRPRRLPVSAAASGRAAMLGLGFPTPPREGKGGSGTCFYRRRVSPGPRDLRGVPEVYFASARAQEAAGIKHACRPQLSWCCPTICHTSRWKNHNQNVHVKAVDSDGCQQRMRCDKLPALKLLAIHSARSPEHRPGNMPGQGATCPLPRAIAALHALPIHVAACQRASQCQLHVLDVALMHLHLQLPHVPSQQRVGQPPARWGERSSRSGNGSAP